MRTRLVVPTSAGARSRRSGVGDIADELRRIMPRDQWLLDLLHDHHVLTTEQITAIAFPTPKKARRRLGLLHTRGVLDRFRHAVRPGSQSWRWTLGVVGAGIVAASRGQPLPRPAAVRASVNRLAASPRLEHLLGVNQVFCALLAHARRTPGTELRVWWPERRATTECGNLVRPDGHGVWAEHGRVVPFWLEYDTGTEQLSRLVEKITGGYAHLTGTRLQYPVLFWLPNTAREDHLHALLARTGAAHTVTVATAATDHAPNVSPAGPVWRVAGHGGRVRLAAIPAAGGARWHG
jgi:hypothetical protein